MKTRAAEVVTAILLFVFGSTAAAETPYEVTTLPVPSNSGSSYPSNFTAVGNAIYFYADLPGQSPAIWKWTAADGAKHVKRIIQSSYAPEAVYLMAFGDKLLFAANADSRGTELWITDGTSAGTSIVKDIYYGGSSRPVPLVVAAGKAYFSAFDPDSGRELWVTDGTEAGTTVIDLTGDSDGSYPINAIESGGLVYFSALDRLWVSDGTAAGTTSLASGVSGTPAGVLNGRVFFLGSDDDHGRELWSTDGTVAGTALVKDINAGQISSWGAIPTSFSPAGSGLFFFAEDATSGRELWFTDGTAAGTQMVKDITPGVASTELDALTASQSGAFFLVDNRTLWFSDGTAAGTIALSDFGRVLAMVAGTNGAYVVTSEPSLYFSNGTVAGTIQITNATPSSQPHLTPMGGQATFRGTDGATGIEPWVTDGTEAGTHLLADVAGAGNSQYSPEWIRTAGANAFFKISNALYRSDGTAAGTFRVGSLSPYYSNPPSVAAFGQTLLYEGSHSDGQMTGLWKTDGTVGGTVLVKEFHDLNLMFASSAGYAVFNARANHYDNVVWLTDGTTGGTVRLKASDAGRFVEIAGRTYFLAGRGHYSSGPFAELWRTDGSEATTRLIMTGSFTDLGTAGGALYVTRFDSSSGRELWMSDGSVEMSLVKDIAVGTSSSNAVPRAAAGDTLIFTADDGVHGQEVWRTDGTDAGTFLLRDILVGPESSLPSAFVASGRYVYFTARDDFNGYELWRTDGTTEGTVRVTEIPSDSPDWLTAFDGNLMFAAHDALRGVELWESDGTAAGTFIAADIEPNGSSYPRHLAVASDLMFFVTTDAVLWALPRASSRITISDHRTIEGDSGSSSLQFTVSRTGSLVGSAQVTYATEDVTATAGQDYASTSGTLSFAAGESSKQIAVTILGDTTLEPNESFAVSLTSATGATIVRDRALGLIEENDRRVALSVAYVPAYGGYNTSRTLRITNAGPSAATVSLRVAESPFEGVFGCDGDNPSLCNVGAIGAGESVDFNVYRSSSRAIRNPDVVPGYTLTASVSALEPENDVSDNTVAQMINGSGTIALPSHLVPGTTATARMSSHYFPATVQLSLTGNIVISPSSATVTAADPVAAFSLTVPSNASGWSTVMVGSTAVMRIPIVLDGEPVKLDTTIVPPAQWWLEFDWDEPVVIPVAVAATLPDGTKPSGTVRLLRGSDGSEVQSRILDTEGQATFSVDGEPIGWNEYSVAYDGDSRFNGVTVRLPQTVRVLGRSTSTAVQVVESPCGESEVVVTVRNSDGHTPTGSVNLSISARTFTGLPLVPTGTAGESRATINYTFSGSYYASISATYVPEHPFSDSSDYESLYPRSCPAPALIAFAATPASVSLLWSDLGAAQYEILRAQAPSAGTFTSVGTTSGTTFVDVTATAGTAYLYKVNVKTADGVLLSTSAADLATTIIFTDDPIAFGVTPIKAVHVTELQQAANAVRTLAAQSPVAFTPVTAGGAIRASDLAAVRTALEEALSALSQPSVSWTSGLAPGQFVRRVHMQQLRNVVK